MSKKTKASSKIKKATSKKVVSKSKPAAKKKAVAKKPVAKKKAVKPTIKKVVKKPVAKKTTKPVKKQVAKKKVVKPIKKAVAKKTIKAIKKVAKKVATKKVVAKKKVVKKPVIKKKTAKKLAKPVKKAVAKKVLKPVVKKQAPKKVAKVVAKKVEAIKPKVTIKPVIQEPIKKVAAVVNPYQSAPVKFDKEPAGKFEMEFFVRASEDMVYEFVSTESGLSEWFCDDVTIRDGIYSFVWDGHTQQARLIKDNPPFAIRFQWLDKTDGSYFEFRTQKDELTNDMSLIITDFASDRAEELSAKSLWQSQVNKLFHVLGSVS